MFILSICILVILFIPHTIKTEIAINASKEKVLTILMETKNYSKWNPFITEINGKIVINEKIETTLKIDDTTMQFTPKVIEADKSGFCWKGQLSVPYLFDGKHCFNIEETSNHTCILYHNERFQGILVWFLYPMIQNTKRHFEMMNDALANHASKNKPYKFKQR